MALIRPLEGLKYKATKCDINVNRNSLIPIEMVIVVGLSADVFLCTAKNQELKKYRKKELTIKRS
jgi:hypothetical protein